MYKRNLEMLIETLAKRSKRLKTAFFVLVFGVFYAYSSLYASVGTISFGNYLCMTCPSDVYGTLEWRITNGEKISVFVSHDGKTLETKKGWLFYGISGNSKVGSPWLIDVATLNIAFHTSELPNHTSVFIVDSITSAGDTVGKGFIGVLNESENEYDFSNATQRIDNYREWLVMCKRLTVRISLKEEVEENTRKILPVEERAQKILQNPAISSNPANDNATFEVELGESGYYLFLIGNENGDVVFYSDEYVEAGMFSKTFSMSNMAKGDYYLNVSISTSNKENSFRKIHTIPFIME